jgi:hypothetical protein
MACSCFGAVATKARTRGNMSRSIPDLSSSAFRSGSASLAANFLMFSVFCFACPNSPFFQVPDRDGVWKNVPGLPTRAYADDGAVLLPEGAGSTVGLIPVVGVIVPVVAVILLFLMIFIAMIRHKIAPQYPGEMPRFGLRQDISGGEDEYDDEEEEGEEDALCVEVAHVESHTAAMSHRRVVCPKGLAFGESQEMQLRTDFSGEDSLERAIAIACHNRDAGGCS